MKIQEAINTVIDDRDLTREQMQAVMKQIMTGECTDAQIGGFLIGLRCKGESVDEITAAAEVMASLAAPVTVNRPHLIDIVGTGGDGTRTFNVSTAATFVAAGAGATVAKHGNRSVSSSSGSADLLEKAGANLNLSAAQVESVIEQCGVGFMYAPMHHSAMRHAIAARKEMAARTIFNVLGPLTNPAQVRHQLVGVYAPHLTEILANVFQQLGSEHTLVVHSEDGMDEISVCTPTRVSELKNGEVRTYTIKPQDFGMESGNLSDLVVNNAEESLAMIRAVLEGKQSAARDIVCLNAGAGIYVAGLAGSLAEGVQLAQRSIDSGAAATRKEQFIHATQQSQTQLADGKDHA
jgi:anthranilate phosphoribosyltransferase